jgi:3-dehydroquinate synthase
MHVLYINVKDRKYPIYIQKGILTNLGMEIKKIYKNQKIAVITDAYLKELYGDKIEKTLQKEGFSVKIISIQSGEKSKSLDVLETVYDALLDFQINREDLILTFGGGVVGDLGGFVAATFMRGIPFIQFPTSLLAQVDSSIGGKTAVNLKRGKNLVGSFYHPFAVFIDPNLLKTLKKKYFYDGLAEVIKYGAIQDQQLFNRLLYEYNTDEALLSDMEEIICRCCSIKRDIVEKDERDKGERMILNFGHTIGHGIEKYFNYEAYTHGEAVAIGMYMITKNSERLGITRSGTSDQIKRILTKYQLPYQLPEIDWKELLKNIQHDKKALGEEMHVVLLEEIGRGYIQKIKKEEIEKYVMQ